VELFSNFCYAGNDIWEFVGTLSNTQHSMLEDRFKWKVSTSFSHLSPFVIRSSWQFRLCTLLGTGDGKEEGREAWGSKGHFKTCSKGKWVCPFFPICSVNAFFPSNFFYNLLILIIILKWKYKHDLIPFCGHWLAVDIYANFIY